MNVAFVMELIKDIEGKAELKAQGILAGNLSYDDYKAATAHYQALRSTVFTIKELARKAQGDD